MHILDGEEVLSLYILYQRMFLVVAARRAAQRLPAQAEMPLERLVVTGPQPLCLIYRDPLPDRREHRRFRAPQADPEEYLIGINVHVETGSMNVFRLFMPELDADVGFVWRLVLRKPRITIHAHQRTTHAFRHGRKVRCDFLQRIVHRLNEIQRNVEHIRFIS